MGATAEERLARIEAQLTGLNQRLDEVVITQLKDHGQAPGGTGTAAGVDRRLDRRGRSRGFGSDLSGQISGESVTDRCCGGIPC